jgi:hypothetical protein
LIFTCRVISANSCSFSKTTVVRFNGHRDLIFSPRIDGRSHWRTRGMRACCEPERDAFVCVQPRVMGIEPELLTSFLVEHDAEVLQACVHPCAHVCVRSSERSRRPSRGCPPRRFESRFAHVLKIPNCRCRKPLRSRPTPTMQAPSTSTTGSIVASRATCSERRNRLKLVHAGLADCGVPIEHRRGQVRGAQLLLSAAERQAGRHSAAGSGERAADLECGSHRSALA